jgi:tetratricopeptide (TPR) repeat protein
MRRRAPAVSFGLSWFAIGLFPVSNVLVPTGILIAERTLFLPSVGFIVAMAGLAAELRASVRINATIVRRTAIAACALLVAAGVARSTERQRVWRNDGFLSIRTVQDSPNSFKAQRAYGNTLFWMDQPGMALEAYERAIALSPSDQSWRTRNELARHFRARGERELEAAELRASLAEMPTQDDTRGLLVVAYLELGNYEAAAFEADTAIVNGGSTHVYAELKSIADSADRVGAPRGSINIGLGIGHGP